MALSHYSQLASVHDAWSEGLLILMYHSVAVPPLFHGLRGLHVAPRTLEQQVRELKDAREADFVTLSEWNRERSPKRQVAVTFDDAYRNLFLNGLPVLQRTGVRALTYVVESLIGKTNEWDDGKGGRREALMDATQLREWISAGHEIGSHGLTHRNLTELSPEEARREITESKKRLEDAFGQPVRHYCYPYGASNEAIRDMVREAGYETATSTIRGFNTPTTDAFALRRIPAGHERPWLAALFGR